MYTCLLDKEEKISTDKAKKLEYVHSNFKLMNDIASESPIWTGTDSSGTKITEITYAMDFSVPCLFAPKAQKGIDKGRKSTRFGEQCIVGLKYTWAQKSS